MNLSQLILAHAVVLAGCQQPWSGHQLAPATAPMAAPYATTAAPVPVLVPAPPYLSTGQVIQPAPQPVPVFPSPSTVVPIPSPSQTPGSIFGPPAAQASPALPPGAIQPALGGLANPIAVPVADEQFAWEQIVDVVSDYFTVAREHRARRSGEVVTEGFIETVPQDGATWLEPHRRDSVGAFNRWESTFQTIRRRALVRVIPDAAGYLVEVIVEKELEDLPMPEKSTAGAAVFGGDGSLPSRRLEQVSRTRSSPRWIPLGRDPALEQRMLAEIHARLSGVATHGSVFAQ